MGLLPGQNFSINNISTIPSLIPKEITGTTGNTDAGSIDTNLLQCLFPNTETCSNMIDIPRTDLNKTRILALLAYNFIHEKHWMSLGNDIYQCQETWERPRMHTAHLAASLDTPTKVIPTQGQGDPPLTLHKQQPF